MTNLDDPRYIYMPMDQITEAKGYSNNIRNSWWAVHPEKGLLFWQPDGKRRASKHPLVGASPQCNSDKRIVDMLAPNLEAILIPLVMCPINVSDYSDV